MIALFSKLLHITMPSKNYETLWPHQQAHKVDISLPTTMLNDIMTVYPGAIPAPHWKHLSNLASVVLCCNRHSSSGTVGGGSGTRTCPAPSSPLTLIFLRTCAVSLYSPPRRSRYPFQFLFSSLHVCARSPAAVHQFKVYGVVQ